MTLPPRLFCDTSFFYACLDPSDANHFRAAQLIEESVASRSDFVTTWDVVSETATLLRYRHSFATAWTFLSQVKPTLRLVPYGDGTRAEAEKVFRVYAKQQHGTGLDLEAAPRLSYCDAVSFVVVTSLLDNPPCLAFDRDFQRLGLTVLT